MSQQKSQDKQLEEHNLQQWYTHVASASIHPEQNMNTFASSSKFLRDNTGKIAGGGFYSGPVNSNYSDTNAFYDIEKYGNNAFGRTNQEHAIEHYYHKQLYSQEQYMQLQIQHQQNHMKQMLNLHQHQQQTHHRIAQTPHHLIKLKSEPMDYNNELPHYDLPHQQQQIQIMHQQRQLHHMQNYGNSQTMTLQQHFQATQQHLQMEAQPTQQAPPQTQQRQTVSQILQSSAVKQTPKTHPMEKQNMMHPEQGEIQQAPQHRFLQYQHQDISQFQAKKHSHTLCSQQEKLNQPPILVHNLNAQETQEIEPGNQLLARDRGTTTSPVSSVISTLVSGVTQTKVVTELIFKTETPDEMIVNKLPYSVHKNVIRTTTIDSKNQKTTPQHHNIDTRNIKTERVDESKDDATQNMQQKPQNFPRRKVVQTDRNESLPICQRCKQVFLKKHCYTKHVAQSVCKMLEYGFKCLVCPISFRSMDELQSHDLLHRNNNFFCRKYCGKYFESIELCEAHEYMNHDFASYVCNICQSNFTTREQLLAHLPHHRNQKRFDCPLCRLCFQTASELHHHRLAVPTSCGKYFNAEKAFAFADAKSGQSQVSGNFPKKLLQSCSTNMEAPMSSNFGSKFSSSPPLSSPLSLPSLVNTQYTHAKSHCDHQYKQLKHIHLPSSLNKNSAVFQLPHSAPTTYNSFKTQIKIEPDVINLDSGLYNEYTNDSFASSHNSSLSNEYSDNNSIQTSSTFHLTKKCDSEDTICCVPHCGVRKLNCPSIKFFGFPKDDKYIQQWLHNLKMLHIPSAEYVNYRICSMHFPKRCINRYGLAHWAVPTFKLGHDDVANLYQNREVGSSYGSGDAALCNMPGCYRKRGECNQKFYNFPKEIKSLIKWCQNSRLPVQSKEQRHFCSRHFEERCIGKFRLKPWAVPTLYLGTPYGKIHDNPRNIYIEEKRCCLPFCRRARSSDINMSLYRFPRDEVLLQRWCYNLRLDANVYRDKNHKICSSHFIKEALGLRKLSPGAVPTLNLGHTDTFNIYENELYLTPLPPPVNQSQHTKHVNKRNSISLTRLECETSSSFPGIIATSNLTEFMDVCCVPGCTSKRHESENVTFHTMPRRAEQLKKWLHNLKLEPEKLHKGMRICSVHFEAFCIGGCMRPFAVPTLLLGHSDTNIFQNPAVIKKLNIRETCCVQTCKRNRDRHHANLHRFPAKPNMLLKWCENLQRVVPDGSKLFNDAICEMHFEDRCLRNKRLEKWAIPTLKLGHENVMHQLPTDEEITLYWAKPAAPNFGIEEGECCVEKCRRNPQVDDVKLYRTPEDAEVLAKWAYNLQIDAVHLTQLRICNLHFEGHCIGNRLYFWAIPTLNLGNNIQHLYENPEVPPIKKELKQKICSQPLKPWTPRCCLPHCRKQRGVDSVMLFRFPRLNRSMLAKWCHNTQMPIVGSQQRRLCSTHFESHVLTKKCPINNSVPTLDLNTPPGFKVYQNPSKIKAQKNNPQRVCMISTCRKSRDEGIMLFRFPQKTSTLCKWFHNLRQKPKGSQRALLRICSEHFEPHSVMNKRLSPHAVPTLNLGHGDNVDDLYPNEQRAFVDEKCVVTGCESMRDMLNVRLFKFPQNDEDQLWKWSNNLKMNPVDCHGAKICNLHFEEDCIGPKNLYKWAIPTLHLGLDDAGIELVQNPPVEDRYTEMIFKCCVPTCGKTRKCDDAQMNSFPKNLKYFKRWKHNLKLEFLDFNNRENYKICNDHFEQICLGKMRLKYGAIPTLNLGHNDINGLFKVHPELLQANLFGKNFPLFKGMHKKDKCTDHHSSDDNENEMVVEDGDPEFADLNLHMHIGNNMYGEVENHSDLPDAHKQIIMKCIYPDCTAPKTMLSESCDMPKDKHLFDLWSSNMSLNPSNLTTEAKLCGLHFMQVYQTLLPHISELGKDTNYSMENAIKLLQHNYQRCVNSLLLQSAQCGVPGCNTTLLTSYQLYVFPHSRDLQAKWTYNTSIKLDDHRRYLHKVCQLHFESHCVTDTQHLRPWAIPTLNLQHKQPETIHQNPDLNYVERRFIGPRIQKCCVQTCVEGSDVQRRLFSFPTDEIMLTKWVHNLKMKRERSPLYMICVRHFDSECVGKDRLREWALPTLELGHSDTEIFDLRHKVQHKKQDLDLSNVKIKKSLDVVKCCISSCRKSRLLHGVRLYSFPRDQQVVKKWLHNVQMTPSTLKSNPQICHLHFIKRCAEGKQLRPWSIPTISLGHAEPIYENPKNVPELKISTCALGHCRKKSAVDCNLRTYGFPSERTLLAKWCKNLKLQYKNSEHAGRVCEDHFEQEVREYNKLMAGAVPTLHLGYDEQPKYDNRNLLAHKTDDDLNEFDCEAMENLEQNEENENCTDGVFIEQLEQNANANISTTKCKLFKKRQADEDNLPGAIETDTDSFQKNQPKSKIPNSVAAICCLKHCGKQKTPTQHLSMFGFPREPELLMQWSENLKLPLEQCVGRVCIEHFELQVVGARKLRPRAVPTLQLGYEGEPKFTNQIHEINKEVKIPNSTLHPECIPDSEDNVGKQQEERNNETNMDAPHENIYPHYAEKLSHSVFRLCCLKHCRKRYSENFVKSAMTNGRTRTWALPTLNLSHIGEIYDNPTQRLEHCCVPLCQSTELDGLFSFPKRSCMLRKWAINTGQDACLVHKLSLKVCLKHFSDICFNEQGDLKALAFPTLQLYSDAPHQLNLQSVDDYTHVADGIKLYKFPTDNALLCKWADNLQLELAKAPNRSISKMHFEQVAILKYRLHEQTVPTKLLGHDKQDLELYKIDFTENNNISTSTAALVNCCVKGCSKNRQTDLAYKWIQNTRIKYRAKWRDIYRICAIHFDINSAIGSANLVPTCNLPMTVEEANVSIDEFNEYHEVDMENSNLFDAANNDLLEQELTGTTFQPLPLHKRSTSTPEPLLVTSFKQCKNQKCSVPNCTYATMLPNNMELRESWCELLNLNTLHAHSLHVCALHFMRAYKLSNEYERLHPAMQKLVEIYVTLKKSTRLKMFSCSVPDCGTSIIDGIRQIKIPNNSNLAKKWLHNTGIRIYNAKRRYLYRVCGRHFESYCFSKTRLHKWAMPTLNLPAKEDIYENEVNPTNLQLFFNPMIRATKQLSIPENHPGPHELPATMIKIKYCCVPNCGRNQHDFVKLYKFPDTPETIVLKGSEPCDVYKTSRTIPVNTRVEVVSRPDEEQRELSLMEIKIKQELMDDPIEENSHSFAENNYTKISAFNINRNLDLNTNILNYPRIQNEDPLNISKFDDDSNNYGLPESCLRYATSEYETLSEIRIKQELIDNELLDDVLPAKQIFQPFGFEITQVTSQSAIITNNHEYLITTKTSNECDSSDEQHYEKAEPMDDVAETTLDVQLEIAHVEEYNESHAYDELTKIFCDDGYDEYDYQDSNIDFDLINQRRCQIMGCPSRKEMQDIILHKFPGSEPMLKKWEYNTQVRVDRQHHWRYRICSRHFERSSYSGARLLLGTLPTLNLGPNRPPQIYQSEYSKNAWPIVTPIITTLPSQMRALTKVTPKPNPSNLIAPLLSLTSGKSAQQEPTNVTTAPQLDESQAHNKNIDNCLGKPEYAIFNKNFNSRKCRIEGCPSHAEMSGITLHKFPLPEDHFRKWVHNTGIQVDPSCRWRYRICNLHFESGCMRGVRFLPGTMPTLNLGPKRPSYVYCNEFSAQSIARDSATVPVLAKCKNVPADKQIGCIAINNFNKSNQGKPEKHLISPRPYQCAITGCTTVSEDDIVKLYEFPQKKHMFKKWLHNTQIKVNETNRVPHRICSLHFEDECFGDDLELYHSAVPTLNLGRNARWKYFNVFHKDPNKTDTETEESDMEQKQNTNELPLNSGKQTNCCITDCSTSITTSLITLHTFPNNAYICRKWLQNIQQELDKSSLYKYVICSRHFEANCYQGNELLPDAVPTLNLCPNKPTTLFLNTTKSTAAIKTVKQYESKADSWKATNQIEDDDFVLSSRCSISSCHRQRGVDGVSLHRLPQYAPLLRKWLENCRLDMKSLNNFNHRPRICSIHFEKSCFVGIKQPNLQFGSIPTLHLGLDMPPQVNTEVIDHVNEQYTIIDMDNKDETTVLSNSPDPANGLVEYEVSTDGEIITYNAIKSGYQKCSLIHCQKNLTVHGVKTYKFPKSPEQYEKWSHNLNIKYDCMRPWKYLICSDHFEKCCFITTDTKTSLTRWAVPTLKLGNNIPKVLFRNASWLGSSKEQDGFYPLRHDTYIDDNTDDYQLLFEPTTFKRNCNDVLNVDGGDASANVENLKHDGINRNDLRILQLMPNKKSGLILHDFNKITFRQRHCCLPHCRAQRGSNLKLFRVPNDPDLLKKWEHNLNMIFLANERNSNRVCQRHFETSLIGVLRLLKGSIPTLHLGKNAPMHLYTNDYVTRTEISDDENGEQKMSGRPVGIGIDDAFNNDSGFHNKTLELTINEASESRSSTYNGEPEIKRQRRAGLRKLMCKQSQCCLPYCGLLRGDNIKLFRIPLNPVLLTKWEHNLRFRFNIADRNVTLVCSYHFEPHVIGVMRLIRGAIPTLNLGHTSPNIYESIELDYLKLKNTKLDHSDIPYGRQQKIASPKAKADSTQSCKKHTTSGTNSTGQHWYA